MSTPESIAGDVLRELRTARTIYPPHPSLEHSWAVLHEEFEELKAEVWRKERNRAAVRREAIQVAAMAIRMILESVDSDTTMPAPGPFSSPEAQK